MKRFIHDAALKDHIHFTHHWSDKAAFTGLCLALAVGFVFAIGGWTGAPQNTVATAEATSPVTPPDPLRILTVGDSNTEGSGVSDAERSQLSYPAQLQTLLGKNYEVLNYGVGGATMSIRGVHYYPGLETFGVSKSKDPNVVLIMLGTNDVRYDTWSKATFESELTKFVSAYQALATKPNVYLLTPPLLIENVDENGTTLLEREAIPAVRSVAKAMNVDVIDIYGVTKDHADLFPDGVHPNAEGYGIIAEKIYETVTK